MLKIDGVDDLKNLESKETEICELLGKLSKAKELS